MNLRSDAGLPGTQWPARGAAALAFLVLLQCCVMAYTTPLGIPPDELAHLSYVRDVAEGGLIPDYAHGRISESRQGNYLTHPPLYYTLLGQVAEYSGQDPFAWYKPLRMLSACFVGLGFFFWMLVARDMGVSLRVAALTTLATCATPMFAYAAGSINNDTLLYLGAGLFFYGVCREYLVDRADTWSALAIAAGLVITFLTKATASAFVVFFIAACLLPRYRQLPLWLRMRRPMAVLLGSLALCGAYFLYAYVAFGAFMPAPATLYHESPPANPLVPIDFAWRYAAIMWERLPIIMSHASVDPFVLRGKAFFYAMLFLPVVGWLVARRGAARRGVPATLLCATDAFALALVGMIVLHVAVAYSGYRQTGLFAGMQPRYFAFLLPAVWLPAFAMETRRTPRWVITTGFFVCAAIAFWTSAPLVIAKQSAAVRPATAAAAQHQAAPPPSARPIQGHLDEFEFQEGRLKVRGWAFDAKGSKSVRRIVILRTDRPVASLPAGQDRPDVAKALGDPRSVKSGFDSEIPGLPQGTRACEIQVAGESEDGALLWLRKSTCGG